MRFILASSAILVAIAPSATWADELSFGGNLAVTSNYISDGLSESDGRPALQLLLEISKNGLHADAWVSNIKDEDGNTGAIDVGTGYRADLSSSLSYDLGYTQHLFNKTHGYSAEIDGSMDYAVNEQLNLSGELTYDLVVHRLGESFGAAYDLGNSWTLNGSIGKVDPLAPLVAEASVG